MPLIAGVHLRIAGQVRAPGEPVPEFETDPARRRRLGKFLDSGRVIRVDDDGVPVDRDSAGAPPLDRAVAETIDKLAASADADYDAVVERAAERYDVAAGDIAGKVPRPPVGDDTASDGGVSLGSLTAREIVAGLTDGTLDVDEVAAFEADRPQGPRRTVQSTIDALRGVDDASDG